MNVHIGPFPKWDPETKKYDIEPRKVEVEIHNYDLWNLDSTICLILEPLIKKFYELKQSAPYVENEDVPEEMRTGNPVNWEDKEDANWFTRWDWVLKEILFALNAINQDWELKYDSYSCKEYAEENARISNGFRLMGKYFRALWD